MCKRVVGNALPTCYYLPAAHKFFEYLKLRVCITSFFNLKPNPRDVRLLGNPGSSTGGTSIGTSIGKALMPSTSSHANLGLTSASLKLLLRLFLKNFLPTQQK